MVILYHSAKKGQTERDRDVVILYHSAKKGQTERDRDRDRGNFVSLCKERTN